MSERDLWGWDIGGAHVKACLLRDGRLLDAAQWPCALWQGLTHLGPVWAAAQARWPGLPAGRHAVTMSGEMVDLFPDRAAGVRAIAATLADALPAAARGQRLHFYAGDRGWVSNAEAGEHWAAIGSANWLASAQFAATTLGDGFLVDIGSTTTDLIAFADAVVPTHSRSDAERLISGELVYHGVVRTPLCAVAPRVPWRGRAHHVMNEFFATSADVYRLTGELDPAHDQQPTADNAPKDTLSTQRRLARMIGRDAAEGSAADWLAFAQAWRALQLTQLADAWKRLLGATSSAPPPRVVAAGCGAFLASDLVRAVCPEAELLDWGRDVVPRHPGADAAVAAWATVCAPCVACAALADREDWH